MPCLLSGCWEREPRLPGHTCQSEASLVLSWARKRAVSQGSQTLCSYQDLLGFLEQIFLNLPYALRKIHGDFKWLGCLKLLFTSHGRRTEAGVCGETHASFSSPWMWLVCLTSFWPVLVSTGSPVSRQSGLWQLTDTWCSCICYEAFISLETCYLFLVFLKLI